MATKKAALTTKKTSASKIAAAKTTKTTVTTAPASATTNTFVGYIQRSARSMTLWRALGAELVGTFLFAGVVIAGQGQPIFVLFALAGLVLMLGAISGAHVNPAITIGALVTRRIGWLRALGYIIAQCVGAALAYIVLSSFLGGANTAGAQAAAYGQQAAPALFAAADYTRYAGKEWYVFFAELTGTAILGFAIANVTRELQGRVAAAFTAGIGIFVALMIAITAAGYVIAVSTTGIVSATAIINPAVAIALHAYSFTSLWTFAIYAVAPVIGSILGFIVYDFLRGRSATTIR